MVPSLLQNTARQSPARAVPTVPAPVRVPSRVSAAVAVRVLVLVLQNSAATVVGRKPSDDVDVGSRRMEWLLKIFSELSVDFLIKRQVGRDDLSAFGGVCLPRGRRCR